MPMRNTVPGPDPDHPMATSRFAVRPLTLILEAGEWPAPTRDPDLAADRPARGVSAPSL